MRITTTDTARLLAEHDNLVILPHQNPDGDALGSAFALLYALQALGKRARVECPDELPARYGFLFREYRPLEFHADYILSVDMAALQMLGPLRQRYEGRIDLCIDHHISNDLYAKATLLDEGAASTTQIIHEVLTQMGARIDRAIANCIFTGLTTDTGCFLYDNVSALTHRVAAAMIDAGAEHGKINKLMFDTKSRGRLEIDRIMMDSLEFYFDDRCAVVYIPSEVLPRLGVTDEELDGVSSFPRKIEGVLAGITIREQGDGTYRISMRTSGGVDASRICKKLGGGGHHAAAGCTQSGELETVKAAILQAVAEELEGQGL